MGSLLAKVLDKLASLSDQKTSMLIYGLDAAGKTTILYRLKLNQSVNVIPTIGFNVEELKFKNMRMTVWDSQGYDVVRAKLWQHYFDDKTEALIYVVDSTDEQRLDQSKMVLHDVVLSATIVKKDMPVLIFANKQDIARLRPEQIMDYFEIEKMNRSCKVQGCSAVTGEGLYEGLEWLYEQLKTKK